MQIKLIKVLKYYSQLWCVVRYFIDICACYDMSNDALLTLVYFQEIHTTFNLTLYLNSTLKSAQNLHESARLT